jgi:serine/threonine protein kinase
LCAEPDAKKRFQREAQAMAAIAHPRIVPVLEVGEEFGIPFIVMPLLKGGTLEDRLQEGNPLSIEEIASIGFEIAEGLNAAHERGLVHRDVKPANVWLDETDGARLLDLGLARDMFKDGLLTHSGVVMGTPCYMSPEQSRSERLDARADLFSLGCILYEMTVGHRPFDGPTPYNVIDQLQNYHPPRVTARRPSVPAMLSNLIMELLAKNPKDRPASAFAVMERLSRIPLHETPRASSPTVNAESRPATRSSASSPILAASIISAAIAGLIYLAMH